MSCNEYRDDVPTLPEPGACNPPRPASPASEPASTPPHVELTQGDFGLAGPEA